MGDGLAQEKHIRQSGGQVISGGRGLLFFCGAGDQAQGLVSSAQDANPVQSRKSHPSIPV